jgi:hypothetical protein
MKKIVLILALAVLSLTGQRLSAQTPYVGGSVTFAYSNYFQFDQHFFGGYEFNDKWAIGGGLGLNVVTHGNGHGIIGGFMAAYVRFTPWHNNLVYTDIKWRTEALLQDAVGVSGADIGFCGSLRFRVSNHIDIFTDFVPLGVRYSAGDTYPVIGILGNGCSLGMHYRF